MRVLLFGATGSAGGVVLNACLDAMAVVEVRAITRRPLTETDYKLWNIVHTDFLNFDAIPEAFRSIDACLFCLGTSATQVSKEDYQRITRDFPRAAAYMLLANSPDAAFHYISGQGTKPRSRMFWSRVKAQTEQELMDLAGAVCWRPAFIDAPPSPSLPKIYRTVFPLLRVLKPFPSLYVSGKDLGNAMIQATTEHMRKCIIENKEIRQIAARFTT
jgi:uncharacterized protein YbjT (DUF2867 family)